MAWRTITRVVSWCLMLSVPATGTAALDSRGSADVAALAAARVVTVVCPGQTMSGQAPEPPPASVAAPTVTPGQASRLRAYSFGRWSWVLAPRGWRCRGASGSGGVHIDASHGGRSLQLYDGAYANHAIALACDIFPSAYQRARATNRGFLCSGTTLTVGRGGSITRTPNLVTISDPQNGEKRLRYVWWFPSKEIAAELACSASRTSIAFCETAFRDFDRRIRQAAR